MPTMKDMMMVMSKVKKMVGMVIVMVLRPLKMPTMKDMMMVMSKVKKMVGMVIVMVLTMMIQVIIMITMKQSTKKAMKAVTMKGFQKVIPNMKMKMKKMMTNIK